MDNEAKQLPGFSRYNVYPDGRVTNRATDEEVKQETDYLCLFEPYVTLANDEGVHTTVLVEWLVYFLFSPE